MIWQRFRKYRGLMVIMLWQAAPPVTVTESGGRVQYGFGYGQGRIDELIFSGGGCEPTSPPLETRLATRRPKSGGMSISGWASNRIRLGGALAATSADTTTLSGVSAKAVAAGEWKWFGVGTGFSAGASGFHPGVYLRAGPMEGLHVRVDQPDISLPVSSTGVGRAGVAYNQSDSGIGVFLGIPLCYTSCEYGGGGTRADLRIPVTPSFDLNVSGFRHSDSGSSEKQTFWGLTIGGHIKR